MYAPPKGRKFGHGLAPLLLAAALCAGCSPAGVGEKDGGHSEAHPQAHKAGAGGHSQVAPTEAGGGDDRGWSKLQNGHEHGGHQVEPWEKLAPEVRARLTHQLALTRRLVDKYKTVADAEAAGYRRQGHFAPGMGVHYLRAGIANTSGTLSDQEILQPSTLLYESTEKNARLVGFMYVSGYDGRRGPIEGFAGPYDAWHGHKGLCDMVRPNGEREAFGSDGSISKEQCEKLGGVFRDAKTAMVHVWTVPGFESPLGVFSGLNPRLTCPDGTYHVEGPSKTCRKS